MAQYTVHICLQKYKVVQKKQKFTLFVTFQDSLVYLNFEAHFARIAK
jgi:hypothetical protein